MMTVRVNPRCPECNLPPCEFIQQALVFGAAGEDFDPKQPQLMDTECRCGNGHRWFIRCVVLPAEAPPVVFRSVWTELE